MWHSREAPDLARDGNRERVWTQKISVSYVCNTLSVWERVCVRVCESVCSWEWENAGLFLIGCCTLDPFSSLGVALLGDLDGCGWRKNSLIDVLSTQTHSDVKWGPPVPLRSSPPTASIETAPFLRLAVTKPSEREKARLCRGKQDERIWREKIWHAPPSSCFKWQTREKPDIWRNQKRAYEHPLEITGSECKDGVFWVYGGRNDCAREIFY